LQLRVATCHAPSDSRRPLGVCVIGNEFELNRGRQLNEMKFPSQKSLAHKSVLNSLNRAHAIHPPLHTHTHAGRGRRKGEGGDKLKSMTKNTALSAHVCVRGCECARVCESVGAAKRRHTKKEAKDSNEQGARQKHRATLAKKKLIHI